MSLKSTRQENLRKKEADAIQEVLSTIQKLEQNVKELIEINNKLHENLLQREKTGGLK